jgi:WXG100 family type VII secretion target
MRSLSVNPAQLQELSTTINSNSNAIRTALADLDAEVTRLKGSWDGEAKRAYETAQRDWNTKINEMNQLLATIATKTAEIGTGYTSTDARGAARFS